MLEAGGELDLALEPLGAERCGQLGMEQLQGDRPIMANIVGQVDGGHATAPQFALEAVAIGQTALELLAEICHLCNRAV